MINKDKIIHTATQQVDLKNAKDVIFGTSYNEYTVLRYTDISNLTQVKGYLVLLTQRIKISNLNGYNPGTSAQASYAPYPALLINKIQLEANAEAQVRLHSIYPRTLNSSVSVSGASSSGSSDTSSHQTTNGSSTTNVNTFGVSANLGFFGGTGTGGIGGSYSHSTEHTHSHDESQGSSHSHSQSEDHSAAMSVKNWSSSLFQQDQTTIQWLWSQTYPWDALNYNQVDPTTKSIILPDYMQKQLYDGNLLSPPSELSLFGLDFMQQASWIVEYPKGVTGGKETLKFSTQVQNFSATHGLNKDKKFFLHMSTTDTADTASYDSPDLDLSLYALAAISEPTGYSPASIGFMVDEFTIPLSKEDAIFKIVSPYTNLEATGTGFGPGMTTHFTSKASITINFKISEKMMDHELVLVHWLEEGSASCKIDWEINQGKFSGSILLDEHRVRGNENDLDKISLRVLNRYSINFHDYLQLGLNEITLTIAPTSASKTTAYTLSSIALR